MRIRLSIFFVLSLFFHAQLKAQKNNREYNYESKVLVLVINEKIFKESLKINKNTISEMDSFSIYNTYKQELITIKKFNLFFQRKLEDGRSFSSSSNKITESMKEEFIKVKGDFVYIDADITIDEINYTISFGYKTDKDKDNNIIMLPSNRSVLSLQK